VILEVLQLLVVRSPSLSNRFVDLRFNMHLKRFFYCWFSQNNLFNFQKIYKNPFELFNHAEECLTSKKGKNEMLALELV